jgi:hypothetical protein
MVKPRSRTATSPVSGLFSQPKHRGRRLLALAAAPAIMAGAFLAGSAPAQGAVRPDTVSAHGPAGSVPAQAAARSDASDPPSSYGLVNYEGGPDDDDYCLGVSGDENDQPSVLWQCNGHADQRWQFENVYPDKSAGGYTFMNLVNNNGSCLAVAGGAYAGGTDLYGWTCKGTNDQFWAVAGIICGAYAALLNYNAYEHGYFYVAGVSGGKIANGTNIVLWKYQGECNNQFWNWILNLGT